MKILRLKKTPLRKYGEKKDEIRRIRGEREREGGGGGGAERKRDSGILIQRIKNG